MKNFIHKSPTLIRPNAERGASLLEGIAYLGIAAVVILGAVSLLTNAFGSAQTNKTTEEVVSIRTAVRKLYMGQTYGTTDMTANLIAAKIFPTTLTPNVGNTAVTNSWNGNVTVTGTGGGSTFTIAYAAVPKDVCINVVSGATGWVEINRATANPITSFPATPAEAVTTCSGATNLINFIAN